MKPLALLALAVLTTAVYAQAGPPPGRSGGPGGMGASGSMQGGRQSGPAATQTSVTETIRILGMNKVQAALGLNLNQWTALSTLVRSTSGTVLTEEQAFNAVAKILNTAQADRLRELLVQDLGYNALLLSSVRAKLHLTEAQAKNVAALVATVEISLKGATNPSTRVELLKSASAGFAAVLTPEQDAQLRALAGLSLN